MWLLLFSLVFSLYVSIVWHSHFISSPSFKQDAGRVQLVASTDPSGKVVYVKKPIGGPGQDDYYSSLGKVDI